MATTTTVIGLRRPDGPDFVRRTLDLNDNWNLIDALFHSSTGHKHTGAGTNGPNLLLSQSTEVDDDATEAATNDTLSGSTRLVNNMNRIRYWITQISGVSFGTAIGTSLATHVAATAAHGATGAVVGTTNTQTLTGKTLTGPDGTTGAPTYSFTSATNTGMLYASGHILFSLGGAEKVRFTSGGEIQMATAVSRFIPGATSFALRDNANANDNMLITDAGAVTFRSTVGGITTLTATTLAGTLSTAAQTNVTSLGTLTGLSIGGNLTFTGASRLIIPGTTDFAIRNNGNSADNMRITDAGAVTFRSTVGGITTLTATTLAGTLSTAAQTNVTSLGTLTGLTVSGAVVISTGAITVNTAGNATYNRQYVSARVAKSFSATPTYDWNDGNVQAMTLTAAVTSSTFSNGIAGGRYVLILTQDATGGRTHAWPSSVKWPGNTAPTLSGASKLDLIGFIYDGTNYYGSSSLNYL